MPHAMPQAARRRCNLPDTVPHVFTSRLPDPSHAATLIVDSLRTNHDLTRLSTETADASPLAPMACQARPTRKSSILSFLWPSAFRLRISYVSVRVTSMAAACTIAASRSTLQWLLANCKKSREKSSASGSWRKMSSRTTSLHSIR